MAKVEWDYSHLAAAYVKRPDYAVDALNEMFQIAGVSKGARVCDIGAGVAHLTIPLLDHGCVVDAVEPNDAMRAGGKARTSGRQGVAWHDGTGEATGMASDSYDFVTFGSSFNVCDRPKALQEVNRLLRSRRWFSCMWNHRDLDDPLQSEVESVIKSMVPSYGYGTRREDQKQVIADSKLFGPAKVVTGNVTHAVEVNDWIEAWRSHATLQRQAGGLFHSVIQRISDAVSGKKEIEVPYTTRIWVAQKIA